MANDDEADPKKEEKATGKWAAEAYDLLKLFNRTGRTFYGLIVLLLGWTLVVVLLGKMPAEANKPPQIFIPWFQSGWRVTNYAISVPTLFAPGAIIIVLWWSVYSGFAAYIFWPVRTLLRSAAARTVYWGSVLLNFVVVFLLAPFELFQANRWIGRLSPEEKETLLAETLDKKKLGAETVSQILQVLQDGRKRKIRVFERTYGVDQVIRLQHWDQIDAAEKAALIDHMGKKRSELEADNVLLKEAISHSGSWVGNLPIKMMEGTSFFVRKLRSRAVVAFAPIKSFNYQEDLNSARAPAQAFAVAIELVRWKLARRKSSRFCRFVNLPLHWSPSNSADASRLRRLAGADVLIWGSYLVDDPNKIWLNIHTRLPNRKELDLDQDGPALTRLFPYSIEPSSVVVIDQRNVHDAYVVALLGLIHTINSRRNRDTRAAWSDKSGLFAKTRATFRILDDLYLGASDLDKLIELLAFDAFLHAPSDGHAPRHHELYPSTETMLSDLASEWVGCEMEKDRSLSSESWADRLMPVIEKCTRVNPTPEHYYRLGALHCIKGEPEKALHAFTKAKHLDRVNAEFWAYASAQASRALSDWSTRSSEAELAKYAACCARTINLGGDYARTVLKKKFDESANAVITRLINDTPSKTFDLVVRMLDPAPASD